MNPEIARPDTEEEFDDSPYADTSRQKEQYQENLKKQRENIKLEDSQKQGLKQGLKPDHNGDSEIGDERLYFDGPGQTKWTQEMMNEYIRRMRKSKETGETHESIKQDIEKNH